MPWNLFNVQGPEPMPNPLPSLAPPSGQWAEQPAPEPLPATQRPLAPVNPEPSRVREVLTLLAPLITAGIAGRVSGQAGAYGALAGANRASDAFAAQQRQDALLRQQDAIRQQTAQRQQDALELQRQQAVSKFVQDSFARVNAILDPLEHQAEVERMDRQGSEQWGLRPGWLKRSARFSDQKRAGAVRKDADAILSKLETSDMLEEALKSGDGWNMSIEFPALGRAVTLAELAKFAGRPKLQDGTYMLATKGEGTKPVYGLAADKRTLRQIGDIPANATLVQDPQPQLSGTGGTGALTTEGLALAATVYRTTGVMPPMGMGDKVTRKLIINEAARQMREGGGTPTDVVTGQADYKSDAVALTQTKKQMAAAQSFESKALKQADIILTLSRAVPRTSFPFLNRALLAGKKEIQGDSATQRFYNAVLTFTTEYAKIMEGSTGSAAASTEGARREAATLISTALSDGTVADTISLMKQEMRFSIEGYQETIGAIQGRMRGVAGGQTTPQREQTTLKNPYRK